MTEDEIIKFKCLKEAGGDVDKADRMFNWIKQPYVAPVRNPSDDWHITPVTDDGGLFEDAAPGTLGGCADVVPPGEVNTGGWSNHGFVSEDYASKTPATSDDDVEEDFDTLLTETAHMRPDVVTDFDDGLRTQIALAEFMQREGAVKWEGGECPVEDGTPVELLFSDCNVERYCNPEDHGWGRQPELGVGQFILAYRVLTPPSADDQTGDEGLEAGESETVEIPEGFTRWEGGECPVPRETLIEFFYRWPDGRPGGPKEGVAGEKNWTGHIKQETPWHSTAPIIAYRVLTPPSTDEATLSDTDLDAEREWLTDILERKLEPAE